MSHAPWTKEQAEKWAAIKLKDGVFARVDLEDFERLSRFKWNAMPCRKPGKFRAVRRESLAGQNKRRTIYLHREIMNHPDGVVDHINGDALDNRKENLRVCTVALNNRNKFKYVTNTSGYKGVYPHGGKFQAQIRLNGKPIYLGTFENVEDASRAYEIASIEYHGEFSKLVNVKPIVKGKSDE